MKIAPTGQSVITNSSGNTFRIVRNSDKSFRIMPVESDYAGGGNALGISSSTPTTQDYSNISKMKWTFEPVVNRFFSEYNPERFDDPSVKERLNCYGYVMGHQNIKDCAESNTYLSGYVRFFLITRHAISDYPHGKVDIQRGIQCETNYKDMAGDNMFTSSNISIGEKEACIDTYNDVDFYVFKPTATRNYTIKTTSFRIDSKGVIGNIDVDDLDCEIYDKNGSLVYTAKNVGQINKEFSLIGG